MASDAAIVTWYLSALSHIFHYAIVVLCYYGWLVKHRETHTESKTRFIVFVLLHTGSGEDVQLGIGNNEEKETFHTGWVCESGKYKPWNDGKLWKSRCNARWLPEPADRARWFKKRAAWCWAIWWRSLLGALGAPEMPSIVNAGVIPLRGKAWGGNEYGQCSEEPERKDDTGRPLRRDIVIPQRCEGFKTISMTEKFSCRAKDLFEILMDENRWKNGSLIVQKWRFGSWPDGIDSTVRLILEEPKPGLTLYGNVTGGECTERMAGSYFPEDTGSFWFWNLRYLSRVSLESVEFNDFGIMIQI
ncbi:unnamed protein product [Prunus armeniaca]|uniref:Uncharacterized protein n=1 Tax=Prunus armeniaca TaxID=36596 RepID=A0A6J5TY08_PRUAR|nr:unnamed protein product [Prunus armeniaca]